MRRKRVVGYIIKKILRHSNIFIEAPEKETSAPVSVTAAGDAKESIDSVNKDQANSGMEDSNFLKS